MKSASTTSSPPFLSPFGGSLFGGGVPAPGLAPGFAPAAPCAACALIFHIKNKQIVWRAVWPAALAGSVCAVGGALLAQSVDAELLRKLFGGFLILVGLSEIFLKGLKKE